jgi:hypothetical protein
MYHKSKENKYIFFKYLLLNSSSPRYSNDFEVQEMNAMVDDIERVLNNIAQQLKQVNIFLYQSDHSSIV